MRAAGVFLVFSSVVTVGPPAQAQAPGVELQAGLGYARVFDGGGISFAAAVERPLSSPISALQHALGGTLWYAHTSIGSASSTSTLRRDIAGIGLRYQLGFGACCRSVRPFLAVPVQLMLSKIPDRTTLQGGSLLISGIPDRGPPSPVEDLVGSEWGWGTGLELGVRIGLGSNLSAHTSAQGLYQDIYADGTRHGAWNWHAGLTYQLGTR
jgi:hypothetical protein